MVTMKDLDKVIIHYSLRYRCFHCDGMGITAPLTGLL